MLLLIGSGALSLLMNLAQGYWVFALIAGIGFLYGGLLSTFPSLTANLFGARHLATNYGMVLLGFGIGAVIATQVGGHYKNLSVHDFALMYPAFVIASACAFSGSALILALRQFNRRAEAKKSLRT
jgi:OFA family oxalate/formate antiporter-like MFS transporter